jgi:hypothetical protein
LREERLEMEVGSEPETANLARLMSTTRLEESQRTPDQLQGSELAFQSEGRLVRDLARSHIACESSDLERETGKSKRRRVRVKRGQWKGNLLPFLPMVEGWRWSEVTRVRRRREGRKRRGEGALASESGPYRSPGVAAWVGKCALGYYCLDLEFDVVVIVPHVGSFGSVSFRLQTCNLLFSVQFINKQRCFVDSS